MILFNIFIDVSGAKESISNAFPKELCRIFIANIENNETARQCLEAFKNLIKQGIIEIESLFSKPNILDALIKKLGIECFVIGISRMIEMSRDSSNEAILQQQDLINGLIKVIKNGPSIECELAILKVFAKLTPTSSALCRQVLEITTLEKLYRTYAENKSTEVLLYIAKL